MTVDDTGPQLILVVGVGRSGTSLMAGMLGQMGFHLTQPEVEADDTNARGVGEPRWVVDFHHRLMRRRRVTATDSRPAAWERTYEAGSRAQVRDELRAWLRHALGQGADVVVEDPCTVWFLPLWMEVAGELGAGTATVTMLRHPADVIASAKRFYGDWQSDASRAGAWINVILETERVTRERARAFVAYEALLADWPAELRRAGGLIGAPALAGASPARFPHADKFVDPTLHRNRVGWDAHDVPESVRDLAEEVWGRMLELAAEGGDTPVVRASLDDARARYLTIHAEAEAIAQSAIVAARKDDAAPAAKGPAPLRVRLARRMPQRYRRSLRLGVRSLRARFSSPGGMAGLDLRRRLRRSRTRLLPRFPVTAGIATVTVGEGRIRLLGEATLAAEDPAAQRIRVRLVRCGRLAPLRRRITGLRLPTTGEPPGFAAELDGRRLRRSGRWEVYVTARAGRAGGVARTFKHDPSGPPPAVGVPARGGLRARLHSTPRGGLLVEACRHWAAANSHRLEDGALVVTGLVAGRAAGTPVLQLHARGGEAGASFPMTLDDGDPAGFTAHLQLGELASALASAGAPATLVVRDAAGDVPLFLPSELADAWAAGTREIVMSQDRRGDALLALRSISAALTDAHWEESGELAVAGRGLHADGDAELVALDPERISELAFPMERVADGRFAALLAPAAVDSLDGPLPLPEGRWELLVRHSQGPARPVMLAGPLLGRVPVTTTIAHKPFALAAAAGGNAVLAVGRDLDPDELGRGNQRRLRRDAYAGRRSGPLSEAVVYTSFRGRQYSDSPRAIHEELVRRGAPLEHFWIVRDGACHVPDTARVLREGSREHFETMARARYVVTNDHFPTWFERRPEQTCVQTWHGTPLKKLGFDVSELRGTKRKFERGWERQLRNWQYVVSPNRFSTPILEQAYRLESEMLETGYPRDDVLAGPQRDAVASAVRARLGLPAGVRVVLYAPTFRDHAKDERGRYRLDWHLDLDRLREAVGPDTVLLVRKHHYIVDAVPTTPDGLVRDVSSYPDGTEILLAADVLITDYSSMIVDFANTGRPMLFYTYDLDQYRDEIRGFYLDFEAAVPGPLLRTSLELADALREIDAVRAQFAQRYDAFRAQFCELDDGGAAARVVDRLFAP